MTGKKKDTSGKKGNIRQARINPARGIRASRGFAAHSGR